MDIDGKTRLYGVVGAPVSHSLSPLVHNAAFRFYKLNAVYVPFPLERPDAGTPKALMALGVRGLSVTLPHKGWAAKIADQRDTLSGYCGAANTLVARQGKWHAYNTDGAGALQALQKHLRSLRGKGILLIGYGGSATAIAHALLAQTDIQMLAIAGRNSQKRRRFVQALQKKHKKQAAVIRSTSYVGLDAEEVDVIIHATPLGMEGAKQELPLPENFIQKFHWVFDIVYTPIDTPLLQHAARKGARIIPGYLMLLYQACLQFEIFSGKKAPQEIMERELLQALRGNNARGSPS